MLVIPVGIILKNISDRIDISQDVLFSVCTVDCPAGMKMLANCLECQLHSRSPGDHLAVPSLPVLASLSWKATAFD